MSQYEEAAKWLEHQDDMSDLAQQLAKQCDEPDVDLSWVFPYIAKAIRALPKDPLQSDAEIFQQAVDAANAMPDDEPLPHPNEWQLKHWIKSLQAPQSGISGSLDKAIRSAHLNSVEVIKVLDGAPQSGELVEQDADVKAAITMMLKRWPESNKQRFGYVNPNGPRIAELLTSQAQAIQSLTKQRDELLERVRFLETELGVNLEQNKQISSLAGKSINALAVTVGDEKKFNTGGE